MRYQDDRGRQTLREFDMPWGIIGVTVVGLLTLAITEEVMVLGGMMLGYLIFGLFGSGVMRDE